MIKIRQEELAEVFDDIILGRGVKQVMHDLEYDHKVYASLFVQRLRIYKYHPVSIKNVSLRTGYRIPAFYLNGKFAVFGYIFWESFPGVENKQKIWESVVRNSNGDCRYILPDSNNQVVFANLSRIEPENPY
ncbi:MAG: hypothetical protein JXR46_15600 [Calditrichaceae bacterium]|nr:hypothetical protein [Calditrichaceae bacterium]MBN2710469.1 hypothetical protein [Calditrichaceae bacterium]RQV93597.1 MAG: hypothetical protein EH224_12035 [Calditrichota bacterium]